MLQFSCSPTACIPLNECERTARRTLASFLLDRWEIMGGERSGRFTNTRCMWWKGSDPPRLALVRHRFDANALPPSVRRCRRSVLPSNATSQHLERLKCQRRAWHNEMVERRSAEGRADEYCYVCFCGRPNVTDRPSFDGDNPLLCIFEWNMHVLVVSRTKYTAALNAHFKPQQALRRMPS